MPEQLGEAPVVAEMFDDKGRNFDAESEPADGRPQGIIVGELVGEGRKAAESCERTLVERDRGAESRLGESRGEADERVRQEMAVDAFGGELRPNAAGGHATIETADRRNSRLLDRPDHIFEIGALDPDVAVRHDQKVVACMRQHIDKI